MNRVGQTSEAEPFVLGNCRVDPAASVLSRPDGEVSLEPKVMAVLEKLAERPGEVISRQAFTDTIWAREYGGDESLTRAVSLLRKALGDARKAGVRIDTVPRKGYRLTVDQQQQPHPAARYRPLLLGALAVAALLLFVRFWTTGPMDREPTIPPRDDVVIAVLPFDNLSPVEEDRYLADGLADEVLSALTRNSSLAVIAGNSSFRFRGEDKKNLERLVRQLNVTHVVDGSVRRTADHLRVGVHLVDMSSGLVSWSNVLNRPAAQAYEIPGLVAADLLAQLDGTETGNRAPGIAPVPAAYDRLLQARALLRQDPGANTLTSLSLLEDAVRIDPKLAEAWALMALARLNIVMDRPSPATTGYRNRDPGGRLATSRNEARRALALDSRSPEALLALTVVDYRARLLPLTEAEAAFRAVLDVAPTHPNATMRLGMLMVEMGRLEDAVRYFRRAMELDPLSLQPAGFFMNFALQTGRREEVQAQIASGNHPWFPSSYFRLESFFDRRDPAAARRWLNEARKLGHFWSHGASRSPQQGLPQDPERLHALMERAIGVMEQGSPDSDPELARDFIAAAEDGLILHFWVGAMLGNAEYTDEVFEMILQRLAVDDIFMRGALFRRAYREVRADPRVMAWFDAGTQLHYWLESGNWPDFCQEPELPYDCEVAAKRYAASNAQAMAGQEPLRR